MKWGIMCLATFGEWHPEWVKSNGEIRAFDNINAAHLYADLQNQTWKWSYYQVEELPKEVSPYGLDPQTINRILKQHYLQQGETP